METDILTTNGYAIGWIWLKNVPLEDWAWLIEVFATMTDNIDIYDCATFNDEDLANEHFPTPGKQNLSNFGIQFTDSSSQYNKLLRTQNKLKQKRK